MLADESKEAIAEAAYLAEMVDNIKSDAK